MALGRDARYEVHFHIQGAFNKLYKADTDSGTALMRVSTPHMSEVTTIELVRQETEMPIPKIIASNESDHSDFSLEWMLVELVAGQPLRKRWKKFPMRAKENLIKQFVGYQVELCRRNLKESGTSVNLKRKRLNL